MNALPDQAPGQPSAEPSQGSALGAEIRRLRRGLGLSQRELTRMIGLSAHSNLADYESAKRLPPADIVSECQRALGVTDGRLLSLHAQALADRANRDVRPVAGPIATLPAAKSDDRARVSLTRRRISAVLVAGGIAAACALGVTAAESSGGQPAALAPTAGRSPNGTTLVDRLDPKQAGCEHDASTAASTALVLPVPVSVQGRTLSAGTVIGHITLRRSADCHAAWARLNPMPVVAAPSLGTVDVSTFRPADGKRTAFHLGVLTEAYVNLLLTGRGCIQAEGSITLIDGPKVTASTRCVSWPARR